MSLRSVDKIAADVALKDEKLAKTTSFRDSKHFQPLMIAFICFGFDSFLSVYMLYYMKVFLDVYHISTGWIQIVQALFLVWNAVNDPMMGYFQDIGCCGMTWIMDRRKVLIYTSPVFAFSYMIFWFPWSTTNTIITGIHLLVGLFLFDTFLTLVLSAYCGILVEACSKHSQRVRCLVYAELFGILGGSLILPLNVYSDEANDFGRFQLGAFVIAIVGAVTMAGGAYFIAPKKEHELHEEIEMAEDPEAHEKSQMVPDNSFKKAVRVSWQIIREPRFLFLFGAHFMRILRRTATGTFLMIFVNALVSRPGFLEAGSPALSLFYSFIHSMGSILFIIIGKPLAALGTHKMMLILHAVALTNVIIAFFVGRGDPLFVIIYLGVEITFSSAGGYSFFMLLAGEVIDTDTKQHKRTSPLSTLIFTLKALFTKPAEQLAPLILITLLDRLRRLHRVPFKLYQRSSENRRYTQQFDLWGDHNSFRNYEVNCTINLPFNTNPPLITCSRMDETQLFIGSEVFIISVDYWYKRRVLHESDSKANPLEIPLNEEEYILKKRDA